MGDETIVRIFGKLDGVGERLARIEAMLMEHKKYRDKIEGDIDELKSSIAKQGERIGSLEQARAGAFSLTKFLGWAVAALIAGWEKWK